MAFAAESTPQPHIPHHRTPLVDSRLKPQAAQIACRDKATSSDTFSADKMAWRAEAAMDGIGIGRRAIGVVSLEPHGLPNGHSKKVVPPGSSNRPSWVTRHCDPSDLHSSHTRPSRQRSVSVHFMLVTPPYILMRLCTATRT